MRARTGVLLALGLAGLTSGPSAPAWSQEPPAAESFAVKLEAGQARFGAEGALALRFTLSNTSGGPITVLKWNTPLEGFSSNVFRVTRDGEPVRYVGRLVKRGAPRPEDYLTIEPGGEVSAEVDLAEGYAVWEAGRYEVSYRLHLLDAVGGRRAAGRLAKDMTAVRGLRSNVVRFELTASRAPRRLPLAVPPSPINLDRVRAGVSAKAPTFRSCSTTQQGTLNEAHTTAAQLATEAIWALVETSDARRPASARYRSWFGSYVATRYTTALAHFQSILGVYVDKTVTFDCACAPEHAGAFAYVFGDRPYEVYLCNSFWTAPLTGTDSRAGTLIHEASHFNVVADTDDHAYGQTAARALAASDPAGALDNGDSHEYFAENTPGESMGGAHVWAALSEASRFTAGSRWSDYFCTGQSVCEVADVNGDGRDDLVAFVRTDHVTDDSNVYVALSEGRRFGPAQKWHDYFCTLQEVCAVGDVNGDGKADLVAFVRTNHGPNDSDVWVALSDGTRFGPAQKRHDYFCTLQEVCAVGDVNGDGKADLLAFVRTNHGGNDSDVWVALSDGTGFGPGQKWQDYFCTLSEDCAVADVNGDGKADVLAFVRTNHGGNDSNVWVALSDGARFGPGQKWQDYFCTLNEDCAVGDVNGDGKADVLAFVRTNHGGNDSDVWVALSDGARFGPGQKWQEYFCTLDEVCAVGDVDGDAKSDVLAFLRGR